MEIIFKQQCLFSFNHHWSCFWVLLPYSMLRLFRQSKLISQYVYQRCCVQSSANDMWCEMAVQLVNVILVYLVNRWIIHAGQRNMNVYQTVVFAKCMHCRTRWVVVHTNMTDVVLIHQISKQMILISCFLVWQSVLQMLIARAMRNAVEIVQHNACRLW